MRMKRKARRAAACYGMPKPKKSKTQQTPEDSEDVEKSNKQQIVSTKHVSDSEDSGSQGSGNSSSKDVSSSDVSDPSYVDSQAATDAADSEGDQLNDSADGRINQDRPERSKQQQQRRKQQQQRRKQSVAQSNTQPQPLHDTGAAGAAAASGAPIDDDAALGVASIDCGTGSGAAHSWPIVARSRVTLNSLGMNVSVRLFKNIMPNETAQISVAYVVHSSNLQHGANAANLQHGANAAAAAATAAAAEGRQAGGGSDPIHSQRLGPYPATLQHYGRVSHGRGFRLSLSGVCHGGELTPYLCSRAGQERFEVVLQEQVGPSELELHVQPVPRNTATLSNDSASEICTADVPISVRVTSTLRRGSKHTMTLSLPAAVTAAHFSHVRSGAPCPVLVGMVDDSFTAVDAQGGSEPQQWFAGEVQSKQTPAPTPDRTVVVVSTLSQTGAAQYVGRSVRMISAEAASPHTKLTLHLEAQGATAAAPTQQQHRQPPAGGSSAKRQMAAAAAAAAEATVGEGTAASPRGASLQPAGAGSGSRGRSTSHHAQPSRPPASEGGMSPAVPAGQPSAPGLNAPGSSTEPAPLSAHCSMQRSPPGVDRQAESAAGAVAALPAQPQAGSTQRQLRNNPPDQGQQAAGVQQSGERLAGTAAALLSHTMPAPAASPMQLGGSNSDRQQAASAGLMPVQPAGDGGEGGKMGAGAAAALEDAAAAEAAPGQSGRRKQRQVPAAAAGPEWVCDLTADSKDEVAIKQEPVEGGKEGSAPPPAAAAAGPSAPAAAAAAAATGSVGGQLPPGFQLPDCDSPVQMTEQLQQLLKHGLDALLPAEHSSSLLRRVQQRMRPFRREQSTPNDWKWLLTDYCCVQAAVAAGQLQGVLALDDLLDP